MVFVEKLTQMQKTAFKPGVGAHGQKPVQPNKDFRNVWYGPASEVGLPDRFTYDAVTDYLWANGKFSMKRVGIFL